jgi:hypothetical protein
MVFTPLSTILGYVSRLFGFHVEALLITFSQRLLNYLAFKSFDYEAPPKEQIVSDLRQIGGFLRVLRFPPPIKLASKIIFSG